MAKTLLVVVLLFGLAVASQINNYKLWEDFKQKYNKVYATQQEHDHRFEVFQASMERARRMNERQSHATYGVTPFSDLTPEEFKRAYLMNVTLERPEAPVAPLIKNIEVPTTFDWKSKSGVVTPVKNQGQCGSCWAFSATETIESVWALAGHSLAQLAPQQIVDCDQNDYGCNGGWPYSAYSYVQSAGGLESESSYPYVAYDEQCRFNAQDVVAKVTGWQYVTQSQDETQMQNFLYSNSPLSVCVDAQTWQDYTGGVITAGTCGQSLDHCVQATGWSVVQGMTVWNVRNSWGTSWGNNGYLYVQLGQDVCGIAQVVTVPKV